MDDLSIRIIQHLQRYVPHPIELIKPNSLLVADLSLDGDDYAYLVLRTFKKEFGIKVPAAESENVYTVQDLIDMVRRHVSAKQEGGTGTV